MSREETAKEKGETAERERSCDDAKENENYLLKRQQA